MFSAGLLGYVEANYQGDEKKNELCTPVPHPNTDIDFLKNNLADAENSEKWTKDTALKKWLQNSRLNFESHILNASPMIKILSFLSKIPFLRLSNKADEAQQKATKNIKRLLDTHESQ